VGRVTAMNTIPLPSILGDLAPAGGIVLIVVATRKSMS
jgi:hypothetical protein